MERYLSKYLSSSQNRHRKEDEVDTMSQGFKTDWATEFVAGKLLKMTESYNFSHKVLDDILDGMMPAIKRTGTKVIYYQDMQRMFVDSFSKLIGEKLIEKS